MSDPLNSTTYPGAEPDPTQASQRSSQASQSRTDLAPRPEQERSADAARFRGQPHDNVSPMEAWLSLAGGTSLVWRAIRGRGASTLPAAAMGGLLLYRGATRRCPVYSAAGIDRSSRNAGPDALGIVTIDKPGQELYRFWRDLTNAPKFMSFVEQVEVLDDRTSRWRGEAPGGYSFDYKAEIIEDTPGEGIRWRSIEGAPMEVRGSVRFTPAPAERGTCVIASLVFGAGPGGGLRGRLAKPFAEYKIHRDLARFKQLMETGEIATTEGQPSGRAGAESSHPGSHPPARTERSQPEFGRVEHVAS